MSAIPGSALGAKAKDALARHAWREAFDLLSAADASGDLSPDQLELLAQACWWVGRLPDAIEARERAYAAHLNASEPILAASDAIRVAGDNLLRNAQPAATAWLQRAERLLNGVEQNPAHGWLAAARSLQAGLGGDFERAREEALRAHEIAVRFGDRSLEAVALSNQGISLISAGSVVEGLALLDEAMVAAIAGEIDPLSAGGVSCTAISACSALGDWRRAAEWTDAQDRWCQREHINGFPGMCRLHRAEIKQLRGDWLAAESEARRATEELEGYIPAAIGLALYEIGLIRLRRGDLPAAEEALQLAHSYGRDPEPARSLLRLAEGKIEAAFASIKRAVDEPEEQTAWGVSPSSDLGRLALLPALVEIALAAQDLSTARTAADELVASAERYSSPSGRAAASSAVGAVMVAEGDIRGGEQALRRAVGLWTDLEAPYETARARVLLAAAYAAEGDADRALFERRTARAAFERLGAAPDLRRVNELLGGGLDASGGAAFEAGSVRVARAFVFTDIVDSTRLAELLGDTGWQRVIRWHDQTLRSLVAEYRGEEIKGLGDGFFLAFDDPDRAIECAVAIQRRLEEQRRTQGLALDVRIGIHWAEANRAGLDYQGAGVNEAARIGAVASGGEILASAATLEVSRRAFSEESRRTVALRGISQPVEVVSISWRS